MTDTTVIKGADMPEVSEPKKIAIVGLGNTGKSIIFNKLSNSYSIVANYPQTTVESISKVAMINGVKYKIWDTPGINSLRVNSDDERITREMLFNEKPDIILFVGDSARLKRSLVLLAQILELNIPTALILNKMDDASRHGIVIETDQLSRELRIPVIEAAVAHEIGFEKIEEVIGSGRAQERLLHYPKLIEDSLAEIDNCFTRDNRPSRALSLLLLGGAKFAEEILSKVDEGSLATAIEAKQKFHRKSPSTNVRQLIFQTHERWADGVAEKVLAESSFSVPGFSQRAAWASRHPVLGWPIVGMIMWITFYGVSIIATAMATYLDTWIFIPLTNFIDRLVTNNLLNEFLVGNFGILTMGVMNAVVTVVPILIVFFVIINFLEDVGYLPNLSVLFNRLFSYFGLTGKSVLSMTLGFGCNTMATLTSRMLETRKERIIASSLIALGIPCAVQLGVMIAILATAPFSALLLVIGTVLSTQIVVGVAMNKFVPSDRTPDFILELPDFKWPNWNNILRKTYFRLKWFLEESLPLFVLGAALMFALQKTGLLDIIKQVARPVITGMLSLPDKATEVFILVLSRRELGAVYFKDLVDAGGVDYYQIVVGLTVMTLFIPCIANTMVMIKELGMKWALSINAAIIVVAIIVGSLQNSIIRMF